MPDIARSVAPDSRADPVLAQAPHRVDAVTLVVHDLDGVARFYEEVIGLSRIGRDGPVAVLGACDTPLLHLRQDRGARRWSSREAGLFHTAFVLPRRADLGAWLRYVAERHVPIAGASDHLVSEAVYLADPEGNGVEVYADRPSAGWRRAGGAIAMSTEVMDVDAVLNAATARWTGLPQGGRIGHVHLQAGDLSQAGPFYAALLGFEITARYPGALFFGSGGYHHQLAVNLWNSRGAGPRTEPTTGLAEIAIGVRTPDPLDAVEARLAAAAVAVERTGSGLTLRDPWNTVLRLEPAG